MKTIKRILMLIMTLKCMEAAASVPNRFICVAPEKTFNELNLTYIGQMNEMYQERSFNQYMPTNVTAHDSETDFATKWLAHLSRVMDTEEFRNTGLGQANKSIRTPVSANLSVFRLSIKPLLGEAKLQWDHVMNGQIRLDAIRQTLTIELSRSISANTKFVVSHLSQHSENLDKITLAYSF